MEHHIQIEVCFKEREKVIEVKVTKYPRRRCSLPNCLFKIWRKCVSLSVIHSLTYTFILINNMFPNSGEGLHAQLFPLMWSIKSPYHLQFVEQDTKFFATYIETTSFSIIVHFFSLPCCMVCRILVPQLGIKPMLLAVEVWSFNHWTSGDVPGVIYFASIIKQNLEISRGKGK